MIKKQKTSYPFENINTKQWEKWNLKSLIKKDYNELTGEFQPEQKESSVLATASVGMTGGVQRDDQGATVDHFTFNHDVVIN